MGAFDVMFEPERECEQPPKLPRVVLTASHVRRALTLKDLETGHAKGQPRIIQSAEPM